MDRFFEDFRVAYGNGDGYGLSMTLSPLDTPSQPNRLSSFFRSTNAASAVKDFKYRILYDNSSPFKLSHEEGTGWVDVYFAYWKVVGEILNAEAATKANENVGNLFTLCTPHTVEAQYSGLYCSTLAQESNPTPCDLPSHMTCDDTSAVSITYRLFWLHRSYSL